VYTAAACVLPADAFPSILSCTSGIDINISAYSHAQVLGVAFMNLTLSWGHPRSSLASLARLTHMKLWKVSSHLAVSFAFQSMEHGPGFSFPPCPLPFPAISLQFEAMTTQDPPKKGKNKVVSMQHGVCMAVLIFVLYTMCLSRHVVTGHVKP